MSRDLFKNYNFKIENDCYINFIEAYQKIKVVFKKIDNESILTSINGSGNFSLYLQNRFFNFEIDNETKRISAFEGDLSFSKIKNERIKLPNNITNAILSLDTHDEIYKGCGSYIPFNDDKIIYDKSQMILQIGEIDDNETLYKFFSNAYAQILQGKLSGLIFTEIDI